MRDTIKHIIATVLMVMIFCFVAGCSGAEQEIEPSETQSVPAYDAEKATEIKNELHTAIHPAFGEMLYTDGVDDGDITVLCSDEDVHITFRLLNNYEIPYFADGVMDDVKEVLADLETAEKRISFMCYLENDDGLIDGTLANWETKNYTTGTFVDDSDETLIVGAATDDIYEHFREYQPLVYSRLRDNGYDGEVWGEVSDLGFTVDELIAELKTRVERDFFVEDGDGGYGLPTTVIGTTYGHCEIACVVEESGFVSAVIISTEGQNSTVRGTYTKVCNAVKYISPRTAFEDYCEDEDYMVQAVYSHTTDFVTLAGDIKFVYLTLSE